MSCHHIFIFVGQIPSYQTITCSLSRGFSLQGGTILSQQRYQVYLYRHSKQHNRYVETLFLKNFLQAVKEGSHLKLLLIR